MGIIHLVAGRLDNADAFFDRVLGTPAVAAKPGIPGQPARPSMPVSYTHLRANETVLALVCRLLLEKKKTIIPEQPSS